MTEYEKVVADLEKKGKSKQETKKKSTGKKSKTKKVKSKGKTTAKKVATKTLKDNLKEEYQVSMTVDGDTRYCAGSIIELDKSFGKFEGKYIIDKVTHSVSSDYSCDLEMLKVGAREEATKNAIKETKAEQAKKDAAKKKPVKKKSTTKK